MIFLKNHLSIEAKNYSKNWDFCISLFLLNNNLFLNFKKFQSYHEPITFKLIDKFKNNVSIINLTSPT